MCLLLCWIVGRIYAELQRFWEGLLERGQDMEAFGEKVAGASARRAVRCLNRAAMVISEGVRGKIEGEAVDLSLIHI